MHHNYFVICSLLLRSKKKKIKILSRVWCEKIGESKFRPCRPALLICLMKLVLLYFTRNLVCQSDVFSEIVPHYTFYKNSF